MVSVEHSKKILFVDDEYAILNALKRVFHKTEYHLVFANSGLEGLNVLENQKVDLIVSDMRMPLMNGSDFLIEAKKKWPDVKQILLTGYAELDAVEKAKSETELYCSISKPWEDDDLLKTVQQALN